jgi:hypothetical protein
MIRLESSEKCYKKGEKMEEINKSGVTPGIKACVEYGGSVPDYQYSSAGVNIKFNYQNKEQISKMDDYFQTAIYPGCHIYLSDANGKTGGIVAGVQSDRIAGVDCGQNQNNVVNKYLSELFNAKLIDSVTIDNIIINGKYDEVAQKVVAAKIAEMKMLYEQAQNRNFDAGREM